MKASAVMKELGKYADPKRVRVLSSYFKTGKGEYGEGDIFIGLTVPNTRIVAKEFRDLPLNEVQKLLKSKIHEYRLCALEILVFQMEKILKVKVLNTSDRSQAKKIYDFYLAHTQYVNGWDLVDTSARDIVGAYVFHFEYAKAVQILSRIAKSKSLWEKRIAMVATYYFITKGVVETTFIIAKILLTDSHDLIQKAVGWMMREAGKKNMAGSRELRKFLNEHAKTMPRTMLRYAIEKFTPEERKWFMAR